MASRRFTSIAVALLSLGLLAVFIAIAWLYQRSEQDRQWERRKERDALHEKVLEDMRKDRARERAEEYTNAKSEEAARQREIELLEIQREKAKKKAAQPPKE